MAIILTIYRVPTVSVFESVPNGFNDFVLETMDDGGERTPDTGIRFYDRWDCLWFLLDPHDREVSLDWWDATTTATVLSGAVIGRRLAPSGLGRQVDEPLDVLRWNTSDDVALVSEALAGLGSLAYPPPGAPEDARVYHAHRCPDSGSPSEWFDIVEEDLSRLRAFYAAAAQRGEETLHALD